MKLMVILFSSAFAFVCTGIIFADEFFDDFENPAQSKEVWEVVQRDWVFEDGYCWAPGAGGLTTVPMLLLDIEVEDGMVLEAQCSDKGDGNWSNFAIIYGYEEEDLAWSAGAGVGNNQWRMFQFTPESSKGGAWGVDFVGGVAVDTPFIAGEWYNIRIEIDGANITMSASSEPESEDLDEGNLCTLPDPPKGRIGLGSAGASPMFNWFRVTGRNVLNLFSVEPGGKLATSWGEIKGGD